MKLKPLKKLQKLRLKKLQWFNPDDKLVQLKSLEALKEVANGDANKIFIPFEATSALSSLGAITDVMKNEKEDKKTTKK